MSKSVQKREAYLEGLKVKIVTLAAFTLSARRYGVIWNILKLAAGMAITLPKATGKNPEMRLYVGTTFTGNCVIKANGTDTINGLANVQTSVFQSAANTNTVTMNGTTTGGVLGSFIILNDMGSGQWLVEMNALGTGTAATPFSNT